MALALYIFAQAYSKLSKDSIITKTTKCIFCRKSISEKVHTLLATPISVMLTALCPIGPKMRVLHELARWQRRFIHPMSKSSFVCLVRIQSRDNFALSSVSQHTHDFQTSNITDSIIRIVFVHVWNPAGVSFVRPNAHGDPLRLASCST